MVAYSFKPRFAEPILDGTKTQTIRANGKRRHSRVGEELQLYTGMRTRNCKLIRRAECIEVLPVRLLFSYKNGPVGFFVDKRQLDTAEMETFAYADGFGRDGDSAVMDMTVFWLKEHGDPKVDMLAFDGALIRWKT